MHYNCIDVRLSASIPWEMRMKYLCQGLGARGIQSYGPFSKFVPPMQCNDEGICKEKNQMR